MDAHQARFEQLYGTFADRVHAYVVRRAPEVVADDVVADVFVVVWRRLDRVPEGDAFPWLVAIARRVLANRHRSDRRSGALWGRLTAAERTRAGVDRRSRVRGTHRRRAGRTD